jgi:hypothetical protein
MLPVDGTAWLGGGGGAAMGLVLDDLCTPDRTM